ncbi:peptidylprolyl isomerase [Paraclostridium bifermentans]|nr:peptidylprolyl isomerase [Paraclostridium bifermentans]
MIEAPDELPIAYIDVENIGVIEAELYPHIAPNTVNNFISLANNNFYDNLTFHRIVKNFVIQGGCPEGSGMGGPGYSIEGEFNKNNFRNDLKHTEGVLSMARSQSKNSGGSQFFIITKSAPHLNGKYAGFGKVINGMDLVYKIEDLGSKGTLFVIKSIKIDTKGETYNEPIKYK